jgi:ankyrin repeat protein
MTPERLLVDGAAEAVAQLAVNNVSLAAGGEPVKLVGPLLEKLDHSQMARVASILFQQFLDTVAAARGRLPVMEPLGAATEKLAMPLLARLEKGLSEHRAFQSAVTLSPLLQRVVALSTQCCCVVVREVSDHAVIVPLLAVIKMFVEVFTEAVLERFEQFRPLDAARISLAHHAFAEHQTQLMQAWSNQPDSNLDAKRVLAPPPERPVYHWRNEELRQFWEKRCAPKFDDGVPIDSLAAILLRAAGIEMGHDYRQAVMKRLFSVQVKQQGRVAGPELDSLSPEVRRCGGLKAWVTAVLTSDGAEAKPPAPTARTWAGPAATRALGCTATTPASARSFSARSMGWGSTPRAPRAVSTLTFGRRRPARGETESNPLLDSAERNLLGASQFLIHGAGASVDARHGVFADTALHHAAARGTGHAPMASLLLESGAPADAEDKHLVTPLHVAASCGHGQLARKLIKHGADVKKEDRWSVTALHRAADSGQTELAQLLLDHGAHVDVANGWGATPLHRAATRGQLSAAERLLASGADANAEDGRGDQPLHIAATRGDYAMVKLLLEHGADAAARARAGGRTAEACAKERGHAAVVTLLQHCDEWITLRPTQATQPQPVHAELRTATVA